MNDPTASDATSVQPPGLLLKFLTAEQRSPTGTGRWTPNRWRSVRGELVACRNGLHATSSDNLLPFLDAQLWRVEINGEHLWHTDSSAGRKLVARRMRIVERVEAWNDRTARLFAADCAERVLPLFERERPDDPRPRAAISVARRFANGDATRDELDAARDAARDAVWDAARDAAWAAARDAARAAAGTAARDAAWDAAGDAAGAAAWAAAGDAARAAAGTAECAWQQSHLAEMLGLVEPAS
jgi:hypothetical protein